MAGFLQLVIWLGCIYLVFKAVGIFQVALGSSTEDRGLQVTIGVIAVVVAVLVALLFLWLSIQQGEAIAGIATL